MKFAILHPIKKGTAAGALLFLLAIQSTAHELHDFSVARFWTVQDYIMVDINDTTKGVGITCAAYDESGALLASQVWFSANLATRAQIPYTRKDKVASVRCVKN